MKPKPSQAVREKFPDEVISEGREMLFHRLAKQQIRNEIIEYLKSIEEADDWISVSDKLPEFDGKYLCVINQTQECKNTWVYQKVVDMIFSNWILIHNESVTHWQSLPNTPTP